MMDSRITMDILQPTSSATAMEEDDKDSMDTLSNLPLNRKLLTDLCEEPGESTNSADRMKVYLRIRPLSDDETKRNEDQQCLTVNSCSTVTTNAPPESHAYKSVRQGRTSKYTFSHIFDDHTTQREFFNQTMLELVKNFIDGQNCLVFSYGVTNSGKTYTIQGNPKDAGVLPRALDVIFNSVQGRQWERMNLKPQLFTSVKWLTPDEELFENKVKERVLKLSSEDDIDVTSLLGQDAGDISSLTNTTAQSDISSVSSVRSSCSSINKDSLDEDEEKLFEELNNRIREQTAVDVEDQGRIRFSIWVSFVEIYNEQIYDLLEPMPKKKGAKRVCLKLKEDQNGSPFVKGLKEVKVDSADEAYKLMTIGQRNLKTACTKLNHNSSRSHCIFNIKIIRVLDKDNPLVSRISMLSLCDLAGSERYTKTQTTGERLKEAGNINTSLLTLSRCIEMLRHTQKHKDHRVIPFRESKLTRLFQNFFVGQGTASMIVNVSPSASTFDETQNVFRFSAKANKVVTIQKPIFIKPKLPITAACASPIARGSISWATPGHHAHEPKEEDVRRATNMPLPADADDDLAEPPMLYTQENIDELVGVVEMLNEELERERKSKLKLESKIRKQVCQEMKQQFVEIEDACSERIRAYEQIADDKLEKKIQIVKVAEKAKYQRERKMLDDEDEWVSSVLLHAEKVKVERLTEEVQQLKEEVASLKSGKVEESSSTTDTSKASAMDYLHHKLEACNNTIQDQEREIKELNDMLTEAGDTFAQKDAEIIKLQELIQDYEKRLETQNEAIKVLEVTAKDSCVAMETANQSLSKREDCVSGLQAEVRELQGDVQKYRNKSQFFEKTLVEKEQEASTWKQKWEQSREEHSESQEALIHGFNAEIHSLKSQIKHFKLQLMKSPTKSPGGGLMSPDTMATPPRHGSPVKDNLRFCMNQKVSDLQTELDKNSSVVADLEQALHISRSATEDLEKKLSVESDKYCQARIQVERLEAELQISRSRNLGVSISDSALDTKGQGNIEGDVAKLLLAKTDELTKATLRVRELEKQLEDSICEVQSLKRETEKVVGLMKDLEECRKKLALLESSVVDIRQEVVKKETEIENLEERQEELQILNTELKNMVNLTTTATVTAAETQTSDQEHKETAAAAPEPPACSKVDENLQTEAIEGDADHGVRYTNLCLEVSRLREELQERNSKYSEMSFIVNEKYFENTDLRSQQDEQGKRIEVLEETLKQKMSELANAGEELAVVTRDKIQMKRLCGEVEAMMKEKEREVVAIREEKSNLEVLLQASKEGVNETASLNEHLADRFKEVKSLKEKIAAVLAENEKLDSQLKEQQHILNKAEHTEKEKADLKASIQSQKTLLHKEKGEKEEALLELETCRNDISVLKKRLLELKEAGEMKDLQEELEKLKNEKKVVEEKLGSDVKCIESTKEQLCHLSKELEMLKREKEDVETRLNAEIKSVKESNAVALQNLAKEKEQSMAEKEGRLQELQQKLSEKDEESQMLSDNLNAILEEQEKQEAAEEAKKVSRQKMAQLEAELQQKVKELSTAVETVSGEKEKLVAELEQVRREAGDGEQTSNKHKEEIERLTVILKRKEEAEGSAEELESAIADKEMELCKKDREIEDLKLKVTSCESELAQVSKTGEDLKEKVKDFETQLKFKAEDLEEKVCELKRVQDLYEEVKKQQENSHTDSQELREKLKESEASLDKKNTSLDEKSRKLVEVQALFDELQKQQENSDRRSQELKDKLKNLENELAQKKEELEEKLNDLRKVQSMYDELRTKQDISVSDIEEIKEKLVANENELSKKTEELQEKSVELKEVQVMYNELKAQQETSDSDSEKIGRALMDIAALKASVHTHKTLHHKEKGEKEEALLELEMCRSENSLLRKKLVELEDAEQEENSSVRESEVTELRDTLATLRLEKEKQVEKLGCDIRNVESEKAAEVSQLRKELAALNEEIENLKYNNTLALKNLRNEHEHVLCEREGRLQELEKKLFDKSLEVEKLEDAVEVLSKARSELLSTIEDLSKQVTKAENSARTAQLDTECENLKLKLTETEKCLKNEENKYQTLSQKCQELEESCRTLRDAAANTNNSCVSELESLQQLYEAEKLKNEQYQKTLTEADQLDCVSPQTGVPRFKRSLERVTELKEQLHKASEAILEWNNKFKEEKTRRHDMEHELKQTKTQLQQLQNGQTEEQQDKDNKDTLTSKLHDLELQVSQQQQELEKKTSSISELQRQLDTFTSKIQACERDHTGHDEVIQTLKESLSEQDKMLQEYEELVANKDTELSGHQKELGMLQSQVNVLKLQVDSAKHSEQYHTTEKYAHGRFTETKKEYEKTISELKSKIKEQTERLTALEKEIAEKNEEMLKWRGEKDKLVSSFEVLLTKKTIQIQQLQEKEQQIVKNFQKEREQIAEGLIELQKSGSGNHRNAVAKETHFEKDEQKSVDVTSPDRPRPAQSSSRRRGRKKTNSTSSSLEEEEPPRPQSAAVLRSPVQSPVMSPERETKRNSNRRRHKSSHSDVPVQEETVVVQETPTTSPVPSDSHVIPDTPTPSSVKSRQTSRRGRKRASPDHNKDDAMPPLPKRVSKGSMASDSDDFSSHLQVDATPRVAAKTLRRTRKKTGSVVDLSSSQPEEETKPQRRSKRSAKSRLLESFRESPIGRGGKRLLENISEVLSPRSPTKDGASLSRSGSTKSRTSASKENDSIPSAESMESLNKKQTKRRHKLYKEDMTYISEPIECAGEFVEHEDVHAKVTRSLRSRRH